MNYFRTAAVAAAISVSFGTAPMAEEAGYVLATASTGGTYYPVGVALSTLVKVKLEPGEKIGMSAISSAGSGENVRLLRENEAQFAILQGLFGSYAAKGSGHSPASVPAGRRRCRGNGHPYRGIEPSWQRGHHSDVVPHCRLPGAFRARLSIRDRAAQFR